MGKPVIRTDGLLWFCGSHKETLEYFLDKSLVFDSLDHSKIHCIGIGESPKEAYQEWLTRINETTDRIRNFELKYGKTELPKPPPMRKYRTGFAGVLINEWESVEWYTSIGKLYPHERKFPRFWFFRLFMSEHELKLENSLKINRELCKE